MRAMIVAAGRGTRLLPLTHLRPKPALPVRGIPLVGYTLALLAHAGVREVVINVHHLPEALAEAARAWCPPGVELRFSPERELLGTGGAIRRVADFLRESDPCLVLGGDMLCDVDLPALIERHRAGGQWATLLLREDPRAARFGTIGVDGEGDVRRIGRRLDRGGEERAGLYTWVNVLSPRALDALPEREAFGHLDAWIFPLASDAPGRVRGVVSGVEDGLWEPVGTPREYLETNLAPRRLSYWDADARARAAGARLEPELVVGAGAELGPGARLRRAVVWDGERVPAGLRGEEGVFAGGAFHPVREVDEAGEAARAGATRGGKAAG